MLILNKILLWKPVFLQDIINLFKMFKLFNKIKTNQRGSALLLISMLVLTFILVVALGASAIVRNGIIMDREQMESTKAFFASEAGAERILWEIWQNGKEPGKGNGSDFCNANPASFCFDSDPNGDIDECNTSCTNEDYQTLDNDAKYSLGFFYEESGSGSTTTLSSLGSFRKVNRIIKLIY